MLTPLLVLHGIHTGVIEELRKRLMSDPAVLVIMPLGSSGAGFTESFINSINERPECSFCIGRIRDVASELQLTNAKGENLTVTLEATAPGDPLLSRYGILSIPQASTDRLEIVLSSTAARKLQVNPHDTITAIISRRLSSGKFQRKILQISIIAVLPPEAIGMDTGFIDLDFLYAIQDFRDGLFSPLFLTDGEKNLSKVRYYESFRAYVPTIDDVEILEKWFLSHDVRVKTKSRDIANIKNLDKTLGAIILLITIAAGAGFFAFMASTVHASVRRKWKMLGMLHLIGFSRFSLLAYPIIQALITGVIGALLSFCIYGSVAFFIDTMFAEQVSGTEICKIHFIDFIYIVLFIQVLIVFSAFNASLTAARIDPSVVIRES